MKNVLAALATLSIASISYADTVEITVKKPIRVNKTDLKGYSHEASKAVDSVNGRLAKAGRGYLAVSSEMDYMASGKIYTVYDLAKMPIEKVIALRDGDYCIISADVYSVKKEWSWSKFSNVIATVNLAGTFKAENWYPNAANYGTYANLENGKGTIAQKLYREYSLYSRNGERAYVACMTGLNSTTVEEAEAKYDNYASDAFGPLKAALGI